MIGITRRSVRGAGAATAGAVAAGTPVLAGPASAAGRHRAGAIRDVRHGVVVMRDNHVFDHRYGSRGGAGSFADCQDPPTSNPEDYLPMLPPIRTLVARADAEVTLPPVGVPGRGPRLLATQETSARRRRSLPYGLNGNIVVDHATGVVTVAMTNTASHAVSFAVYAATVVPFEAVPVLVGPGGWGRWTWDARDSGGVYDVSVYGPDGFVRVFRGVIVDGTRGGVGIPMVTAATGGGRLRLTLSNAGRHRVGFTLTDPGLDRRSETHPVDGGRSVRIDWPSVDGRYDVSATVDTDVPFIYRFAGQLEQP